MTAARLVLTGILLAILGAQLVACAIDTAGNISAPGYLCVPDRSGG